MPKEILAALVLVFFLQHMQCFYLLIWSSGQDSVTGNIWLENDEEANCVSYLTSAI